jgi:hypothetical protein
VRRCYYLPANICLTSVERPWAPGAEEICLRGPRDTQRPDILFFKLRIAQSRACRCGHCEGFGRRSNGLKAGQPLLLSLLAYRMGSRVLLVLRNSNAGRFLQDGVV